MNKITKLMWWTSTTAIAWTIFAVLTLTNCAPKSQAPEVTATQIGSDVLASATQLQKTITAATDAKTLPVADAQKLTGYVEQVYQKSMPLEEALKAYHAAADAAHRKDSAALVLQLVGDINLILTKVVGAALPTSQLQSSVANLIAAVGGVQQQVAKGMGGS